MKNWKTTAIGAGGAALAAALKYLFHLPDEVATGVVLATLAALGLQSKDHDTTGIGSDATKAK